MCGLFGLVRNPQALSSEKASAVLVELGRLSEERGRDSSGLAFVSRSTVTPATPAPDSALSDNVATVNNVTIVKDTVPFSDFWDDTLLLPILEESMMVIGHTRWATQGSKGDLKNTSPFAISTLVGTHNGDIDVSSAKTPLPCLGDTDTERLYRKIGSHRSHRGKIVKTLEEARGRIALAWYDARLPNRLYLSRAGQSPLSIAVDSEGNLYWASNPNWFRIIQKKLDNSVIFTSINTILEGTLLTISNAEGIIEVTDMREFTPTVRHRDSRFPLSSLFRNFEKTDIEVEEKNVNHKVAPAPVYKSTTKKTNVSNNNLYSSAGKGVKFSSDGWATSYNNTIESALDPWGEDEVEDWGDLTEKWESMNETIPEEFDSDVYGEKIDEILGTLDEDAIDNVWSAVMEFMALEERGAIKSEVLDVIWGAKTDEDFAKIANSYSLGGVDEGKLFVYTTLDKLTEEEG